jgi:hypothetical protein
MFYPGSREEESMQVPSFVNKSGHLLPPFLSNESGTALSYYFSFSWSYSLSVHGILFQTCLLEGALFRKHLVEAASLDKKDIVVGTQNMVFCNGLPMG